MKKINARLLFTNDGIPLQDAGVVIDRDGRVMEIGERLLDADAEAGVVVPGFVNAHVHLELSYLKGIITTIPCGMTAFIREMILRRGNVDEELRTAAMQQADEEMYRQGIVAAGDISNTLASAPVKRASKIYYHTFVELSGLDPAKASEIAARGNSMVKEWREVHQLPASLSPHAPYSVSPALLELLLAASGADDPLSVHVQESEDEVQCCSSRSGPLFEFLSAAGLLKGEQQGTAGTRPLEQLLSQLPSARPCQLVHNTFTLREEIEAAMASHPLLFWCVCIRANRFITGKNPPVDLLFQLKAPVTVGTDSLASNHHLSMVYELAAIQETFPAIPFAELIRWSSLHGARFLGIDHLFGSVRPGLKPGLLHLQGVDPAHPFMHEKVTVERLC